MSRKKNGKTAASSMTSTSELGARLVEAYKGRMATRVERAALLSEGQRATLRNEEIATDDRRESFILPAGSLIIPASLGP